MNPVQMKKAMKAALKVHVFRQRHACVSIYVFATAARQLLPFTGVNAIEERDAILAAIDAISFEVFLHEMCVYVF